MLANKILKRQWTIYCMLTFCLQGMIILAACYKIRHVNVIIE